MSALEPPQYIDNYRILRRIGRGGMAQVFEAIQQPMDRHVALKVMTGDGPDGGEFSERFLLETKCLARFRSANIVTIYDAKVENQHPYIAMELLEGGTFSQRIKQQCTVGQTLTVIQGVAHALAVAHSATITHRDVKPDNILFHDKNSWQPVLTDFGIAKSQAFDVNLTQAHAVLGSIAYMSPEQAQGSPLDHRSDIFSLGVVFYYALTGTLPYDHSSLGTLVRDHLSKQAPVLPAAYRPLQDLIVDMLAVNPEERLDNAVAVAERVAEARRNLPSALLDGTLDQSRNEVQRATTEPGPLPTVVRPRTMQADAPPRTKRWSGGLIALLGTALLGGTLFSVMWWLDEPGSPTDGSAAAAELYPVAALLDNISVLPSHAELTVSIAGRAITPVQRLEPGQYQVTASAPGYTSLTETVTVPFEPFRLQLDLQQHISPAEYRDYVYTINDEGPDQEPLAVAEFITAHPSSVFARILTLNRQPTAEGLAAVTQLARSGDPPAQLQLSEVFDRGIGLPRNIQQALLWSAQAARANYVPAMLQHSALILEHSPDTDEIDTALNTLERLAEQDYFIAHNLLATVYLNGRQRPENLALARQYLEQAAALGDALAAERLITLRQP